MLDPKDACPGAKFQLSQTADAAVLTTDTLKIEFSLKRGNVQFSTTGGEVLLRERDSVPRTYEPAELNGESTFHVEDRFAPDATEGFYGLGQHQSGMFNYRGATVELAQNNTDVAIPLLLSTKGYGLMWNTASLTSCRQPLSARIELELAGGPFRRLLLHIRSGNGPTHSSLPYPHWTYAAASEMGLWVFSIQGPLRLAGRTSWNRAPLSRSAHSAGHYRAGLVLVEGRRRSDFQFPIFRMFLVNSNASTRNMSTRCFRFGGCSIQSPRISCG